MTRNCIRFSVPALPIFLILVAALPGAARLETRSQPASNPYPVSVVAADFNNRRKDGHRSGSHYQRRATPPGIQVFLRHGDGTLVPLHATPHRAGMGGSEEFVEWQGAKCPKPTVNRPTWRLSFSMHSTEAAENSTRWSESFQQGIRTGVSGIGGHDGVTFRKRSAKWSEKSWEKFDREIIGGLASTSNTH